MQVKIILASPSKSRSDESRPIYLRITHQRQRKYFTTNLFVQPRTWVDGRVAGDGNINHMLSTLETRAWEIITSLRKRGKPSLNAFKKAWENESTESTDDLVSLFNEKIDTLLREGREGGARPYKDALASLLRFKGKATLSITSIDYTFLKSYVTDMRSRGCKDTTIGIYLRHLRVIVNEAMKSGIIDDYPFDSFKMSNLNLKTRPRALTTEAIQILEGMRPRHLAVDIFLFSYYNRGITFSDIAKLKKASIVEGRLIYTRTKTGGDFSIKISDKSQVIIDRYMRPNDDYLFPDILRGSRERVYGFLKRINKKLKKVGKVDLNLDFPLTTYAARHTYATTLKRRGVGLAVISEAMGHSSINVTMTYLDSFNASVIDAADECL